MTILVYNFTSKVYFLVNEETLVIGFSFVSPVAAYIMCIFLDRISVNQTSLILDNLGSNINMALELFDMGTLLDLCNYSNNIEIPSVNFTFPNAAVFETDGGAIPVLNEVLLQF